MKSSFGFAALVLIAAAALVSQPAPRVTPGPQQDDSTLLVSGWKITPVGKHVQVDTLPMATAVTPDGKYLLVLNGGYNPPSISVIDTATAAEVGRTRVADGWLGLAMNRAGNRVYVGGGSTGSVFEFALAEGKLTAGRTLSTLDKAPEGTAAEQTQHNFTGDVALSPDGRFLYAANVFQDSLAVINLDSGRAIARVKTGRRPYRILFLPDGKTYLVTNWADGTLSQFQASDNAAMTTLRVGAHPTDMLLRPGANLSEESGKTWLGRLFVAAANTNNVYAIGVGEGAVLTALETINVSLTPREPLGMTPTALGLSADASRLYIACSDANAVAVADVAEDRTRVMGFIPTGWYPTAVRGLKDGRIVIANGKGLRSYPNPKGPGPLARPEPAHLGIRSDQYVGTIQRGTVSFVDSFDSATLSGYTKSVIANSPYRDVKLDEPAPAVLSRIKHVIYVVKENRTYDQMLGDMKEGNGDASLVLFGERFTPNHHKLAREFVLFDNFYVSADVSADGHNWSTAAIASDYVQKLWPNSYAGRRKKYDYEGGEPAALPPANYIWTNARQRGITMRNYGYFATNREKATADGVQIEAVRDPVLAPVTNLRYRAFDLDYSDIERVKVFQQDLAQFEQKGEMPQFITMRLGNDHTSGTAAGKIAPLSSLADNDYALGLLVEAVSKSRFWNETAIFVLEDDAQNGADHVDSHRSPAFVLSPFTRRGSVDSSMYNTTSMLRTIEMILGIRPMTHFDAGASPMTAAFGNPVGTPYVAVSPNISLTDRNPEHSPTAALSRKMNFEDEDLNNDDDLNEVLWAAIKGEHSPRPLPVRSMFR